MSDSAREERARILLVEDNPGDVRLTKEAFNSIEGDFDFRVVNNGEAAIKQIHHYLSDDTDTPPTLILLDLNLPRVDGFSVLDFLNEEFDAVHPPVLVLSSSDVEKDIDKSYRKGCNAYLLKPDGLGDWASLAESIKNFWVDRVRTPTPSS